MSVEIGKGDFMGPSAAQFFHKSEKKKKEKEMKKKCVLCRVVGHLPYNFHVFYVSVLSAVFYVT